MRIKNARNAGHGRFISEGIDSENKSDVVVLTKVETCRFLKCGMSTLPKLGLPVIRIGRSVKYLKSDLEDYLLQNRVGGSNE